MSLLDTVRDKVVAAAATAVIAGAGLAANQAGVWPVTQNQLRIEGWYQKRDRLLDRVEDGTITDFQRCVLSGLCTAMNIKQSECEKRDH